MYKLSYNKLIRDDINIKHLKNPTNIKYNKDIFIKMGINQKKYRKKIVNNSVGKNDFRKKEIEFQKKLNYYVDDFNLKDKFINLKKNDIKNKIYVEINSKNIKNPGFYSFNYKDKQYKLSELKNKSDFVFSTMFGSKIYKKIKSLDPCEKEDYLYPFQICKLYCLFNILNNNGNAMLSILNLCNSKTIEFLYLLSAMFESIYIFSGKRLYCHNFLPNVRITQDDVKKCLKGYFKIEPKPKLKDFIKNEIHSFKSLNNYYKVSIYKKILICSYLNLDLIFGYSPLELFKLNYVLDFQLEYIKNILLIKDKNYFINKNEYSFFSNYIFELTSFLNKLKKENKVNNILELDFGWGIQTLFLLDNSNNVYTIDPFEKNYYNNRHLNLIRQNLKNKKLKNFKFSHYNYLYILPLLLKEFNNTYFDFILINNFNTSDDFLIKFSYSDKLIKKGGYIFINNISNYLYSDFISILIDKYLDYNIFKQYSNSIILQKKL